MSDESCKLKLQMYILSVWLKSKRFYKRVWIQVADSAKKGNILKKREG